MQEQGNSLSQRQKYDPAERLLEQQISCPKAGAIESGAGIQRRYSYDKAGQLLAVGDRRRGNLSYRYDERGNMTERVHNGWRTVFAWDGFNRMTAATDQSGITTTFSYDALGCRLSKSSGETTTLFGWDGDVLAFESTQSRSVIEEGGARLEHRLHPLAVASVW